MHDANLERNRGHPARRLEPQEMRIGRLKHERVKVPREETEVSNGVLEFTLLSGLCMNGFIVERCSSWSTICFIAFSYICSVSKKFRALLLIGFIS